MAHSEILVWFWSFTPVSPVMVRIWVSPPASHIIARKSRVNRVALLHQKEMCGNHELDSNCTRAGL